MHPAYKTASFLSNKNCMVVDPVHNVPPDFYHQMNPRGHFVHVSIMPFDLLSQKCTMHIKQSQFWHWILPLTMLSTTFAVHKSTLTKPEVAVNDNLCTFYFHVRTWCFSTQTLLRPGFKMCFGWSDRKCKARYIAIFTCLHHVSPNVSSWPLQISPKILLLPSPCQRASRVVVKNQISLAS